MHFTINYSEYKDPAQKREKALDDIREWLGSEKFESITEAIRNSGEHVSRNKFTVHAAVLAGVTGYPAQAWYNYIYNLED